MPVVKKVPQRICLGCQGTFPKKDLVRIVRTVEGGIEVDPTGKKSGRGAYVCSRRECVEKARKGKRLEKVLEKPVSEEVYRALGDQVEARIAPGPRVVRIP